MYKFSWLQFALLSVSALAHPASAADAAQQYVAGSWVNVRAQAARNGAVVDHLTVNTPVRVVNAAAGNEFCEVSYGENKRGFVACRLLTDKLLTLQEAETPEINGKPNPAYSPPRAFWIQPSVDRMLAAGQHFEYTVLKPGEREAETKSGLEGDKMPKIRRFPIPEYEAMKERLRNGVIGQLGENRLDSAYNGMTQWKAIKSVVMSSTNTERSSKESEAIRQLWNYWGSREVPMGLLRALELPTTKRSYFRAQKQALAPYRTTETVSAIWGIPYNAVVKSGPKWVVGGHYNSDGYIFGGWDVGVVETNLASPVIKHTFLQGGAIRSEASAIPGGRFPDPDADGGACNIGYAWDDSGGTPQNSTLGSMKKRESGLFYYFSQEKLPRSKATVVRSKSNFVAAGFTSAETFRFDLDGDGVDDILVWEGTGISEQSIHDPGTPQAHYRIVFFNIDGEWHLFLVDEFLYGCGC